MNRLSKFVFLLAVSTATGASADPYLTLTSGLLMDRSANLIVNGSFESGGPGTYWATGTTRTPYSPLPGWASGGGAKNYAQWDNTADGATQASAPLPDGTHGLYFGNWYGDVSPTPTFGPDGTVTFTSPPVIIPEESGYSPPVTLSQTANLSTARLYKLSFWTSGEYAGLAGFPDGIFGLNVAGFSTRYLAAPGGKVGGLGASHVYQYLLHPAASATTITFTNWGHLYSPGYPTELVLDDVILNAVRFGDGNLDGSVDGSDISIWAINFTGALGPNPPNPRSWTDGDFDFDGSVDGSDVALWAQNFTGALGFPPPAPAVVPEPTVGIMVFWLAAAGLRRRRLPCR